MFALHLVLVYYTGILQLVLSNTNRIGDTKYNISCVVILPYLRKKIYNLSKTS